MPDQPNLAAALVAALADLTVVETGRTAKIPTKGGSEYSYKYADIADVVKLTRPILAEHGVVALTPVHAHGDGLACTVSLVHVSGERMDLGPFPFPHGKDAQATGSMVTYHRRYALVAALGIAAGDDDDGASAAPRMAAPAVSVLAGWSSIEEQDAAHHDFQETVKAAGEDVQAHMRDYRKGREFGWPMPKRELDQMWDELDQAQGSIPDNPEFDVDAPSPEDKRAERAAQVAEEHGTSVSEAQAIADRMREQAAKDRAPDGKAKAGGE